MARVEINDSVANTDGHPLTNASVYVTKISDGLPAILYVDATTSATQSNPIRTLNGNISAWVVPGSYKLTITGSGLTETTDYFEALSADDVLDIATDVALVTSDLAVEVASSRYTIVQDEGSSLTQRGAINFVGAGVTAADSGGVTEVTIPGGGGGGTALNWQPQVLSGAVGQSLFITDSDLESFVDAGVTYKPEFWVAGIVLNDGSPGYSNTPTGTDTTQLMWTYATTGSVPHLGYFGTIGGTITSGGDRQEVPIEISLNGPGVGTISVVAFVRTSLLGVGIVLQAANTGSAVSIDL